LVGSRWSDSSSCSVSADGRWRFLELAAALPVLDLPGVTLDIVSHALRTGTPAWESAELDLDGDARAHLTVSQWLIHHGVARPDPKVPYALNAADSRLSFLVAPPRDDRRSYSSIHAQHDLRQAR